MNKIDLILGANGANTAMPNATTLRRFFSTGTAGSYKLILFRWPTSQGVVIPS